MDRVRPFLGEMDEFKAWVRSSPEHGLSLFDLGSVTFPALPDTGAALVRCFAEQKCRWRPGLVVWGPAVVPSAQPSRSSAHLCLHLHSSAAVGPGSAGDSRLVGPAASLHDAQCWVLWVLRSPRGRDVPTGESLRGQLCAVLRASVCWGHQGPSVPPSLAVSQPRLWV